MQTTRPRRRPKAAGSGTFYLLAAVFFLAASAGLTLHRFTVLAGPTAPRGLVEA